MKKEYVKRIVSVWGLMLCMMSWGCQEDIKIQQKFTANQSDNVKIPLQIKDRMSSFQKITDSSIVKLKILNAEDLIVNI